MGLNIKKQRVHDLAREAARRTGRSQTSVIESALERYLDELTRHGDDDRSTRVTGALAALDSTWDDADRAAIRATDLYDEHGLPA
ncbi:type II toxin-antitoxin system VapB family antitoxin [Phycicoccus sp. BSK3Z-2]|uniref:Type II toxin-antitoxin system VapB family antitoxin n=1 Tax=Phycicoccus avicenniae TaxID=2828860 RepID=A0A941D9S3_9MICO|nr:type II toxin-antitoxin system VapB family antitoxin [Phycicoccus avicenniae]MBR7744370.1 type II toxin-antitoxin system VapB family antitoxin [Phycicoccus avicenniae]